MDILAAHPQQLRHMRQLQRHMSGPMVVCHIMARILIGGSELRPRTGFVIIR